MGCFGDVYRRLRVLVTGHTGFKGSWLTLWLHELGAEVMGLALPPIHQDAHWNLLQLPVIDRRIDIRNLAEVRGALMEFKPEVIFHLAAQPLVRRSYTEPILTWETNVIGTANVLEAARDLDCVRSIIAVTSDKVYENQGWIWGYRESDAIGGHDPYSSSKAATELLISSYRRSYFSLATHPLLATARSGNVIGGGDWAEDRLIPDLVRAQMANASLEIRMPNATRPWQHVLDSLSGYLRLGEALLGGDRSTAAAWNFGPDAVENVKVVTVLQKLRDHIEQLNWHYSDQTLPHEATLLHVDSTKARSQLQWRPVWNLSRALEHTADWYRAWLTEGAAISMIQLREYQEDAKAGGLTWAKS